MKRLDCRRCGASDVFGEASDAGLVDAVEPEHARRYWRVDPRNVLQLTDLTYSVTRSPASLSIVQEAMAIRATWSPPAPKVTRNALTWIGTLQPSAMSATYTIRLRFELDAFPKVDVLDPPLDAGHRERLPHV